jgi:hypothetical protein
VVEGLPQDMLRFADEFWDPKANAWANVAMRARAEKMGKSRHWMQSTERRLACAGELAERDCQARLQDLFGANLAHNVLMGGCKFYAT